MPVRGEIPAAGLDAFWIPRDRQPVGDPSQDGIAAGVPPEDQVGRGDLGFADGRVVLDPGLAPEVSAPVLDRVVALLHGPFLERRVRACPRRSDKHEGIHEGVVDRPLKVVPLPQRVAALFPGHPAPAGPMEGKTP